MIQPPGRSLEDRLAVRYHGSRPDVCREGPESDVEGEGISLLPAEPLNSEVLDDAVHWAAVYRELAGFLLDEASAEVPRAAKNRFRRRRDFWRRRMQELTGSGED